MKKLLFVILAIVLLFSCMGGRRSSSERRSGDDHRETPTAVSEPSPSPAEETTQPDPVPEEEPVVSEEPDTSSDADFEEFKRKMDDLEAFFDSYVAFCQSYDATDSGMMLQYLDMMNKYNDAMKALDSIDESQLTPQEDAYYLETMMRRIDRKLLEAANALNN